MFCKPVVLSESADPQRRVAVPQLLHVGEVAVDVDDQMGGDDGLHDDRSPHPEPDIDGVADILAGDKIHRRRRGQGSARPGCHVPSTLLLSGREIERGAGRRDGDATAVPAGGHPANLDGGGHVRLEGRSRHPCVERPAGGGERDELRPAEGLRGGRGGQAGRQGEQERQGCTERCHKRPSPQVVGQIVAPTPSRRQPWQTEVCPRAPYHETVLDG